MGNLRTTSSILSTLQASAADISVAGHILSITNCPSVDYRRVVSMSTGFDSSLLEQLQVTTVTPTAANNTTFSIYITQFVNGKWVTGYLTHTTDATGQTATNICDAWRSQLASQSSFKITGSGTATLILTAQAGTPIFTVGNLSPTTTTISTVTTITPVNITACTAVTPSLITAAAHGLLTGNVITIVSADNTKLQSGTYRVVKIDANTYNLFSVGGQTPLGASATTTATVTLAPQRSRGDYADLVALGVSGATAGATYSQLPVTYISGDGSLMGNTESSQSKNTLYVQEGITNFSAFSTRITEVYHAFAPSTTVSDPQLIAQG